MTETPDPTYEKLTHTIRCMVCQNQTIADSQSPIATEMKEWISNALQEGQSESQIKTTLQQRYGDYILYEPPFKPLTAALWLAPWIVLICAFLFWWRRILRK